MSSASEAISSIAAASSSAPRACCFAAADASAAALLPGKGLKQLYDEDQRGPQYSLLLNVIAAF